VSSLKTGMNALLTPEESVLVLIDHQPFQFANLNSHEPTMIVNNVIGLAKTAKAFGVPVILTTVVAEGFDPISCQVASADTNTIKGHIAVFGGIEVPKGM
jgi:nicotinamidase-related amidase